MSRIRWTMTALALLGALAPSGALGSEEAPPAPAAEARSEAETDPWGPLRLLAGTWEGEIAGKLGDGRGIRTYDWILGGRFLLVRHRSVRLPQEQSPAGDQHEELAVFSYDSERKTIVYREFMIEGVVVRSPCRVSQKEVVCVSEAVESGPGIRARLVLEIEDRCRFVERYELGFGGREPEHYFTNPWTRSPLPVDWD